MLTLTLHARGLFLLSETEKTVKYNRAQFVKSTYLQMPLTSRGAVPDVSSPQTSMKVSWNLDHAFEAVQASIADAVETSSWKAVFPECITLETREDLSIEEQVHAILSKHSAILDALFHQWDVDGKGSFTLTEV